MQRQLALTLAPLQRNKPTKEHPMNRSQRSEAASAQPPTASGPVSSTLLARNPIPKLKTPTPKTSEQSEKPSNMQPYGDYLPTVAPPGAPTKESREDIPLTNPTDATEGTDSEEELASVNETIVSEPIPKSADLSDEHMSDPSTGVESDPSPPRTRRRTLRKTKWTPTPLVKRSFVEDLCVRKLKWKSCSGTSVA